MELTGWHNLLPRPPSATDQPPGFYRYRARKGAPWLPVRIMHDGDLWHCLLNGMVTFGSGKRDPQDIPFILYRAPFHAIKEAEYEALIEAYRQATVGHPLASPDEKIDLRTSRPL